jgi:hypothetical protein
MDRWLQFQLQFGRESASSIDVHPDAPPSGATR